MTQEEFDQIVANNVEKRTVQARGLTVGYEVVGMRIFLDPVSNAQVFQTQYAVSADDAPAAIDAVKNFLSNGAF